MKYLITGNLGYIGPVLTRFIKTIEPDSFITGYDTGFFLNCEIASEIEQFPPYIDQQIFGDVRDEKRIEKFISEADHIIHLAAISNDPMGKEFEKVTKEINQESSIKIAKKAIENKCKSFIFASSCSVYGTGSENPRSEQDFINPLTAYSKSKIGTEESLKELSNLNETSITCLRFATACGYSPNLRLDLVLNDFVASALSTGTINILSNGSPWRPLIDVEDMSRAIYWACHRDKGNQLEIINTGSNDWNYSVKELAQSVKEIIDKNILLKVNKNAPEDKRSYKVNFDKFFELAPEKFYPKITLNKAVENLKIGILPFSERTSPVNRDYLIRLSVLKSLKISKKLDEDLRWNYKFNS